ncbi:alpha-(1,3)-fucosyltransferase 4-like [Notolabrus celidotus]|uniref:alpha-(1,3)-fucosyltransferase 4-like n=1 Tax=Notolabrus celidotus TaxID=1203425 RepID=UPI00148FEC44|nr:alpha-(1,3)-fucosyltransferase 4-like [Notolabrus celidotus]
MGAGAQWRSASRSTGSARRADRRRKCWDPVFRRKSSSAAVATAGFLFFLGVSIFFLPVPEPFGSEETRAVTLLIWTHPFGRYHKLPDCLELYQIGGCTLTDDWSAHREADAVIVHHREVESGTVYLPPEPRSSAQKWIWMNYESPAHTPGLRRFNNVFNLTLTYRTDSDIFLPYGYLVLKNQRSPRNHLAQPLHAPSSQPLRPRLLAWVISNWSESHERVAFYYQLSRHIKVDVFGRAGRPLPEDRGRGSVVRMLGRYQFYLALENSRHTDYITEKLWNAVLAGSIPVVLGPSRQNYERFLPPKAFIHVDDFPSVRALAKYLLRLSRDPVRLRRHLDWRGSYSLHQPSFWAEHYCTACRAVRRTRGRTEVVQDLERWFHS